MLITVNETQVFAKKAEKLLKEGEKFELIDYVAENPEEGAVIAGTGGVRKLRYAKKGKGKSGSYRVIYYYYDKNNPVILFGLYEKKEKENISGAEKKILYKVIQEIKKELKK